MNRCPHGHGKQFYIADDRYTRCKICDALIENQHCDECGVDIIGQPWGINGKYSGAWWFCSQKCLDKFVSAVAGMETQ